MPNNKPTDQPLSEKMAAAIPNLSRLLEDIQSGKSLVEARISLDTQQERELFKRAALARAFDRDMFDTVLAAGLDDADPITVFEHFISRPGIERIPRTKGLYRLKDSIRGEYLKAWETEGGKETIIPPAQSAFSRTL